MHTVAEALRRFAENPWLNGLVGVILMWSGLAEAGEAVFDDVSALELGAHHGVILLGFVHAFKSLPPILIGMSLIGRSSR